MLVIGASFGGGASGRSLGVWTVTLTLGGAAVVALALRSRLRRAVTIPNILISGGLGVMIGTVAAIEGEATVRPTMESAAAANTGESLVWAPFALLLASPVALAIFAVAYVVILNKTGGAPTVTVADRPARGSVRNGGSHLLVRSTEVLSSGIKVAWCDIFRSRLGLPVARESPLLPLRLW